jgi:hypothetical protein
MNNIGKVFEIGYLLVAALFAYEAITRWTSEREKAYIFIIIGALAVFMFFFRRRMRIKREKYLDRTK